MFIKLPQHGVGYIGGKKKPLPDQTGNGLYL
jgi:hypothetical protein